MSHHHRHHHHSHYAKANSNEPAPSPATASSSTLINVQPDLSVTVEDGDLKDTVSQETGIVREGEKGVEAEGEGGNGTGRNSIIFPTLSSPLASSASVSTPRPRTLSPTSSSPPQLSLQGKTTAHLPPVPNSEPKTNTSPPRPVPPPIVTSPYPNLNRGGINLNLNLNSNKVNTTAPALSAKGFVQPHHSNLPRRSRRGDGGATRGRVVPATPDEDQERHPPAATASSTTERTSVSTLKLDVDAANLMLGPLPLPTPTITPSFVPRYEQSEPIHLTSLRLSDDHLSAPEQTQKEEQARRTPPKLYFGTIASRTIGITRPHQPAPLPLPAHVSALSSMSGAVATASSGMTLTTAPATAWSVNSKHHTHPSSANLPRRMKTPKRPAAASTSASTGASYTRKIDKDRSSIISWSSTRNDRGEEDESVGSNTHIGSVSPVVDERVGRSRSVSRPRSRTTERKSRYGDRTRSMGPSALRHEHGGGEEIEGPAGNVLADEKAGSARLRVGTGANSRKVGSDDVDTPKTKSLKPKLRGASLPRFSSPSPFGLSSGVDGYDLNLKRHHHHDREMRLDHENGDIKTHLQKKNKKKRRRGLCLQNVDGVAGVIVKLPVPVPGRGGQEQEEEGLDVEEVEIEIGFFGAVATEPAISGGLGEIVINEEEEEDDFWGVANDEESCEDKEAGQKMEDKKQARREIVIRIVGGEESLSSPSALATTCFQLPTDLTSYREGVPIVTGEQVREAWRFAKESLGLMIDNAKMAEGTGKESRKTSQRGQKTKSKKKVQILVPRARPEDGMAMGLGICFSAFIASSPSSSEAEASTLMSQTPPWAWNLLPLLEDPTENTLYTPVHRAWMRMMDEGEYICAEDSIEYGLERYRVSSRTDARKSEEVDVVGLDDKDVMKREKIKTTPTRREIAVKNGVRPEWRGVLSYEGLMRLYECLSASPL